ncbi:hypothetical protein T4B_8540 [Trichinella pseudospiralis]|uniref:Uncharacterized protein n=2 Tax=Trichinella pseudospiralis TaxID=6337 RepID=A0A0V1FKZ9_TRIPS|nr:hypothetical protein T4A_10129 [Trichinella pseudospiralis]KRY86731.1 hypothetical protein T4D_4221 [Trichinella pseudospiralis]KRZ32202.1 hypothetical protein T4B_8540 [Trichinella pseudospiralis]KRZ38930.1 hypothetical protein T4C_12272 [Trichinella pseudospiralis]
MDSTVIRLSMNNTLLFMNPKQSPSMAITELDIPRYMRSTYENATRISSPTFCPGVSLERFMG